MKKKTNDGRHLELVDEEHCARLGHYFRSNLGDTLEADECVRETLSRLTDLVKSLRGAQTEFSAVFSMRIAYKLCVERETERRAEGGGRQRRNEPLRLAELLTN